MKRITGKEVLLDVLENPNSIYRCIEDRRSSGMAEGKCIRLKDSRDGDKLMQFEWCSGGEGVGRTVFTSEKMLWKRELSDKEKKEIYDKINELENEIHKLQKLLEGE